MLLLKLISLLNMGFNAVWFIYSLFIFTCTCTISNPKPLIKYLEKCNYAPKRTALAGVWISDVHPRLQITAQFDTTREKQLFGLL